MAQIVSIDIPTKRDNNEIGDIVALHEDDVDLSGGGYSAFRVIQIQGVSLSELNITTTLKIPSQRVVFKMPVGGTWSFDEPEEKRVWRDIGGRWQFLENPPKYALTIQGLTEQDITDLNGVTRNKTEKLMILDKIQEKISLDPVNLAEATDLNV